jgi:uncharacterized protein
MQNMYYEMTVSIFKKSLSNLDGLLTKAEAFIASGATTEEALLDARLAPDMFPLLKQVTIASDNAKGASARLAGVEVPVMEDTETTIAQLHERIAKTIAFLDTLTPEQFEDAAEREVRLKYYPEKHFVGADYLKEYALPNFFFHVTTAYGILRSVGLGNGKSDFLGTLTLRNDE